MKKTWGVGLIVALLVAGLVLPSPPAAQAVSGREATAVAYSVTGVVLGVSAAYIMWVNRPGNQDKMSWEVKGPGGFFVGGFMGASFVQHTSWQPLFGRSDIRLALPYDINTSSISFRPGVVGGLKFGYFCHRFPYFGVELDGSYTTNTLRQPTVTYFPPLLGKTVATIPREDLATLNLAFHFLGRYGFLKDKEVPFGRLQPYVGVGPNLAILWSEADSAKNFGLDVVGGVRYMLKKNLSVFVEYKYSAQWDVELEHSQIRPVGTNQERRGTAQFDWNVHKVVTGITFHFW